MFKNLTQLARKSIVIELALAIVLAQSVASVIDSVVNYLILPPIGLLLGGRSFPSLFINLTPNKLTTQGGPIDSIEKAHYAGASIIAYGALLTTLLELLVVVIVVGVVLGWLQRMRSKNQATEVNAWPPEPHLPQASGAESPLL